MGYREQFDLAKTPSFVFRVQQAMVATAINVVAESPDAPYHSVRTAWATQVLRDPEFYAARLAFGVTSNPAISAESLDSDIEFTVSAQWNAYAGVVTVPEAG